MTARLAKQKKGWVELAVHHYLFFRMPLIKPQKFLRRTLPVYEFLLSIPVLSFIGVLSILGLYFASRRWDDFVSTFLYFFDFEGAIRYGICLLFVKTAHEFSHAYMATRYGVRVGTMGIAFLVMMPVPYTDVSGAKQARARYAAGAFIAAVLFLRACSRDPARVGGRPDLSANSIRDRESEREGRRIRHRGSASVSDAFPAARKRE